MALFALALAGWALVQLVRADAGIERRAVRLGPTPVTVYSAIQSPRGALMPVVIIAHGFAGSQQLMQSFALTLAKNGYLAVTFDFLGHGRNLEPLRGDITRVEGATRALLQQVREVAGYALLLPESNGRLALLGHSMASDIVVRYAESDPRVDATVAVSMFSPAVTATEPRNLLIIVGGLEGFLRREALRVLSLSEPDPRAGITYGSFDDGSARRVVFAGGVEHVGVLYSGASMRETLDWLNTVYGRREVGAVDSRGPAIAALLLGIVLLGWPLSRALPVVSRPPRGASFGWRRLLPAALLPAVLTPLLLWRFPTDFLDVMVGGYLAVHFGLYGLLTLACLWWLGRGDPAVRPGAVRLPALLAATALASLYAAGAVGLALDRYVTSFAITPLRMPLLFAMLAGTLLYFLADEWLTRGATHPRGAHLFTRGCFLLSLGIAVALSFEELFFLVIIAAIIIVYFLVYGLFSRWAYSATGHPAVGAVANALAFAWALAAVFPFLAD